MDERKYQNQATRVEALIQEVAAFPDPHVRARTEELLCTLMEMYGSGLARILETAAQADVSGQALLEQFARDELVGSLLLLHGLHPVELEERIRLAIEKVRPTVQARNGTIELMRVEAGTAYLRLVGDVHGCASSISTLKQAIEGTIYSLAPDLDEIRIEDDTASPQTNVPVRFIPRRKEPENAQQRIGKSVASAPRMR